MEQEIDNMCEFNTIRYRVYIDIMFSRYYANVDAERPLPRVRWMMKQQEYPDHFSWDQARLIRAYYDDQKPELEKILLQLEEKEFQ